MCGPLGSTSGERRSVREATGSDSISAVRCSSPPRARSSTRAIVRPPTDKPRQVDEARDVSARNALCNSDWCSPTWGLSALTVQGLTKFVQHAEEIGFDSLWAVEHVVVPAGYQSQYPYSPTGRMPGTEDSDMPDPLVWLTYAAAVTTTIKLATGILILPERNPLVLAKECATIDRLSGGRLMLGIGIGWLKEEFEALGIPWERRTARHGGVRRRVAQPVGGEGVEFRRRVREVRAGVQLPQADQRHDPGRRRRAHRGRCAHELVGSAMASSPRTSKTAPCPRC